MERLGGIKKLFIKEIENPEITEENYADYGRRLISVANLLERLRTKHDLHDVAPKGQRKTVDIKRYVEKDEKKYVDNDAYEEDEDIEILDTDDDKVIKEKYEKDPVDFEDNEPSDTKVESTKVGDKVLMCYTCMEETPHEVFITKAKCIVCGRKRNI